MGVVVPSRCRPLVTVAVAAALFLVASAQSQPAAVGQTTSFSFPSFPAGSCGAGGNLICMHNSTVRNGYIAVTRDYSDAAGDPNLLLGNIGRVLYRQPVVEWPASFNTSFTVHMVRAVNGTGFGDGMSFVMTSDRRQSPPRSNGGFLGLFDQSTQGDHPLRK